MFHRENDSDEETKAYYEKLVKEAEDVTQEQIEQLAAEMPSYASLSVSPVIKRDIARVESKQVKAQEAIKNGSTTFRR